MSVTERLMGIGSWSLRLRPDTPGNILNKLHPRVSAFGHVVITPTWVNLGNMSDANALALSRYTGIYQSQPSEFELAGMGVNGWMGDGNDRGPSVNQLGPPATGDFPTWRDAVRPSYLAAGVTSTIAGTYGRAFFRMFLREIIDDVAARFGAEWRVTNDFKLDFGLASDLFDLTPSAVIVRHAADSGRDLNVSGVTGDLDIHRDVEDWVRNVMYYWGSPTLTRYVQNGGVADIDVPFRAPDGTHAQVDMIEEDSVKATSGDAQAAALTIWNQYKSVRQELRLSSIEYDIGRDVSVGDNVWVFDMDRGMFDMANPVTYRGQTIYPETVRCVGQSWPVRNGMGVWFRRHVKSGGSWVLEWFDLTPFVVWESGETTVEVGAKPRPVK